MYPVSMTNTRCYTTPDDAVADDDDGTDPTSDAAIHAWKVKHGLEDHRMQEHRSGTEEPRRAAPLRSRPA
jgi:hypothetical protein